MNIAQRIKQMKRDIIILRNTGDYENVVEGGYTSIYEILRCKVSEERSALQYETRGFPSVPSFSDTPPSQEYLQSIPRAGTVSTRCVSDMDILHDEEVEELRQRGVRIRILRRN